MLFSFRYVTARGLFQLLKTASRGHLELARACPAEIAPRSPPHHALVLGDQLARMSASTSPGRSSAFRDALSRTAGVRNCPSRSPGRRAEHLHEAALAVEREAAVAGLFASVSTVTSLRPRFRIVSIMRAWRTWRPSGRREEGVGRPSPAPARQSSSLFRLASIFLIRPPGSSRRLAVDPAGLGRYREPGRNGEPDVGHLGEPCALPPRVSFMSFEPSALHTTKSIRTVPWRSPFTQCNRLI